MGYEQIESVLWRRPLKHVGLQKFDRLSAQLVSLKSLLCEREHSSACVRTDNPRLRPRASAFQQKSSIALTPDQDVFGWRNLTNECRSANCATRKHPDLG